MMETDKTAEIKAVSEITDKIEGESVAQRIKTDDEMPTKIIWLKWIDKLSDMSGTVGGYLLPIAALMIVYEILMRYLFDAPSIWVTEVSTYMIVASVFFTIAYTLKENGHIRVDFITNMLSRHANDILDVVTSTIALIFCVCLSWEGLKLTIDSNVMGEVTATMMRMPRYILLALVPIGGTMLSLQYMKKIAEVSKSILVRGKEGFDRSSWTGLFISGLMIAVLIISAMMIKREPAIAATIIFVVLLFSGMAVSMALALFGMIGLQFFLGSPGVLSQLPIVAYGTLDNNVLGAIPLFILTSSILLTGQVGPKLFEFANAWVKHWPGGLAIAAIILCGIFAAITGSSAATAATVSLVALPELLSRGYERKFVLGLLAAGGTLGILFPPSGSMMIYGAMTGESIAQLFMAGVIPGLTLMLMFILYILWKTRFGKNKLPQGEVKATLKERLTATKSAFGGLMIPVIIIGGIYSGIFTPTEAAGVATVYSLILCIGIQKTVKGGPAITKMMMNGAKTASMLLLIIVGANLTSQAFTMMQLAQKALEYILSLHLSPWLIILAVNIFLFLLGMPLEAISILVITLPILFPIMAGLGLNPLWFAVVMCVNMELAMISPPEGLNLFILQGVGRASTAEISKAVIPFLVILAFLLVLVCIFPELCTWLPKILAA